MASSLLVRESPVTTDDAFAQVVAGAFTPTLAHPAQVRSAARALYAVAGLRQFTPASLTFSMGREPSRDRGDYYALAVSPGRVKARRIHMGGHLEKSPPRGVIWQWSASSRRNFHAVMSDVDLSTWVEEDQGPGWTFAMVTLTLPDEWLTIAPTAQEWHRCIRRLRALWLFEAKLPWRGIWKKEFQRRGAPHLHALMRVPVFGPDGKQPFAQWLAAAWVKACRTEQLLGKDAAAAQLRAHLPVHKCGADKPREARRCVKRKCRPHGCMDLSAKMTDPRRISVYFGKHSSKTADSKEYQHRVPDAWRGFDDDGKPVSAGRFWGVWGLQRVVAECLVTSHDFDRLTRLLGRVARGRHARKEIQLLRACGLSLRSSRLGRYRSRSFTADAAGFVLVNDGPRLAFQLARALALMDE